MVESLGRLLDILEYLVSLLLSNLFNIANESFDRGRRFAGDSHCHTVPSRPTTSMSYFLVPLHQRSVGSEPFKPGC